MLRAPAAVAIVSLGIAVAAFGQENSRPVPMMGLDEAFLYARAHQPRIRSALAEIVARRGEARVPRAIWFPQVGGTAQILYGSTNNTTASYINVPEVDIPRIGASRSQSTTNWSPSASTLVAASVDQELYDFGHIAAMAAVADALVDVAHANADEILLEVQLGVEETFHAVLAAHQVQSATEDAYKRAVTHRDYAQAGVKSGLRPPIELTRAEADVTQLEVRRIRAATGLESARAALAAAIGSDALEMDARQIAEGQSPAPAFEEALRQAATRNPMIAAALARLRAQHETARAIKHELLPNLFASATLSGRAGGGLPSSGLSTDVPTGQGWVPDIGNWNVGVVLQWNIFDATVLARRDAALAREEVAKADLDVAKLSVTLGLQRAWLDLDAALKTLPGLQANVTAAEANHAQAEARFKAGLGNVVELADAEALLTNSQLDLAVGQFNVARARASLARVMGQPITDGRKGP